MSIVRWSIPSAFILVITACGIFGSDEDIPPPAATETADSGGPAEVVTDSSKPEPPPPPPLEGGVSTDQITEKYGVFVTPNGTPTGDPDGTRDKPYKTISDGITNGYDKSKYVYVCKGTYAEALTIKKGVPVIGGFDCTNGVWKAAEAGAMSRVESPTIPAITADAIDLATRIEALDIVAPNGNDTTPTSIGLKATASPGLTFVSSKITSGKGKDGVAGVDAPQLTLGAAATGGAGLYERRIDLAFETGNQWRVGALGGVGSCLGAAGHDGTAGGGGGSGATMNGQPTLPPVQWVVHYGCKSLGQNVDCIQRAGAAGSGAAGTAGTDGASAGAGTLSAQGFTPSNATAGTNGGPGFGGKGGDGAGLILLVPNASTSDIAFASTGSGGGAGGCPGLAGTIGSGGQASLGALLIQSPIVLENTTILAGEGGVGGKGTFGSSPTAGGAPGTISSPGGVGVQGGAGGRSGVSGSGAGGSSIAIAHTGAAPQLTKGAVATPGKPGAGVAAETKNDALGNAKTLPASAPGVAKDIQPF